MAMVSAHRGHGGARTAGGRRRAWRTQRKRSGGTVVGVRNHGGQVLADRTSAHWEFRCSTRSRMNLPSVRQVVEGEMSDGMQMVRRRGFEREGGLVLLTITRPSLDFMQLQVRLTRVCPGGRGSRLVRDGSSRAGCLYPAKLGG
jgi:hypothetical protein